MQFIKSLLDLYDSMMQDESKKDLLPQPHFRKQRVHYELVLYKNGDIAGFNKLYENKDIPSFFLPIETGRSNNIYPYFTWDKSDYVLGFSQHGIEKEKRTSFIERHKNANKQLKNNCLNALVLFSNKYSIDELMERLSIENLIYNNILIRLDGERKYLHEYEDIVNFFIQEIETDKSNIQHCIITGKEGQIATTHGVIKGVPGTNSGGASLISFHNPSSKSYGLEGGNNAPISMITEYKYRLVLNYLLESRQHRLYFRDANKKEKNVLVFWTDSYEFIDAVLGIAGKIDVSQDSNQLSQINKSLYEIHHKGIYNEKIKENEEFFLAILRASTSSTISLFDFRKTKILELCKNIQTHYNDVNAINGRYKTISQLLHGAFISYDSDPHNEHLKLFNSIFYGKNYSQKLVQKILIKVYKTEQLKEETIMLLTGYLRRNKQMKTPDQLDIEFNNMPYVYGRCFAICERIQEVSSNNEVNNISSLLKQMMNNPQTILRNIQQRISYRLKDMSNKGTKIYFERLLAEAMSKLIVDTDKKVHFNEVEKSCFMVGYFQQRSELIKKKED